MRIKKISQNAVMVYLSKQDLEYFGFSLGDRVPQAAELHKLLYEVMRLVEAETGIDMYNGGQIVVEAAALSDGMMLNIGKIVTKKSKKRITREQFNRAKAVTVKQSRISDSDILTNKELMRFIESLGMDRVIRDRKKRIADEIFIFNDFRNLESVLCELPDEVTGNSELYREKSRYALVTKIKKGSRYSNIISEFADGSTSVDVVRADIREGWKLIAEGEDLTGMAGAVRDMQ